MTPYKVFSHFSIGKAFGKPDEYVAAAVSSGFKALALTDINSVSGCIEFLSALDKKDVLPILGSYVTTPQGSLLLICKNKAGWSSLIQILGSATITKDDFVVEIDRIQELAHDLIAIVGGVDSVGANFINNYLLHGKFNGDVAVSLETDDTPENISDLEKVAAEYDLPILRTRPVFYAAADDKICQEILQCSRLKLTLADAKPPELSRFFDNSYAISDLPEADNSWLLSKIEKFSLASPPIMPACRRDDGTPIENPDEVLRTICKEGWVAKGINRLKQTNPELYEVYASRIKEELDVFTQAKISNYILFVRDFANYVRSKGWPCGPRGSAGGCLISYLSGITVVDPVCPDPALPYSVGRELIFSRFINKGRFLGGKNSLPDVDFDVGNNSRDIVINYLKEKYGKECTGHIITFNRLDGRGAIKEVFRVTNPVANSNDVADAITKNMPDKAKIQDDLEDLKSKNPKYTTVQYALDFVPTVTEYYEDYKQEFDIANRITDTISHTGQHAAGIVVAPSSLRELFPTTINTKTRELMVALEMADAEYAGAVKVDILGVSAYEKLGQILRMINEGRDEAAFGIE